MKAVKTGTLTGRLKKTVLILSAAMIAMWIFFYCVINEIINGYTTRNMEQTAQSGMSQINTSFLQMEQLWLAVSREECFAGIFRGDDNISFHNAAADADERLTELARGKNYLSGIIIYRSDGAFYRLRGKLSNTAVQRLIYLAGNQSEEHIFTKLGNENYIGYIKRNPDGSGGLIMLMDEADIAKLLSQYEQSGVRFALTAGDSIAATGGSATKDLSEFRASARYTRSARIGSTPFSLWASYTARDPRIHALFSAAMLIMALLLVLILQAFLRFWNINFFKPMQTVIDEVEAFEGGKGKLLPLTGMEQFDGLIGEINDMATRIEAKDKALIVSLKKQINAHFIFNILTLIKALSEKGDSKRAGELCGGLSLLLRYANAGESFISGMEEFFTLQNYVEIMAIRYPNRFAAEIEPDDFLDDVELPRMLLQPIVENSLIHGIIASGKNGTVRVYAEDIGDEIRYIVEDDGRGIPADELDRLRERLSEAARTEPELEGISNIALVNIERRVRSYYSGEYGLEIFSGENSGTKVVLTLPKQRS